MATDPRPSPAHARSFREALAASAVAWPTSETAVDAEPHLQSVVDAIGGLETADVPSVWMRDSALVFAIVGADGAVRLMDPAFPLGSEDVSPSMMRLIRAARKGHPAIGLAESASGSLAAFCVSPAHLASAWPLSEAARSVLNESHCVLMAFRPPPLSPIARLAASAFGLSDLEARVAGALLEAPTLEVAAGNLGVGRETARSALKGAMAKMGVKRTPALVRRMIELLCGPPLEGDDDVLEQALNLTPAQARVARLSAQGSKIADVAESLGVRTETVKSHLRSVFAKSGIPGAKDLGRLDVEMRALTTLANAREIVSWTDQAEGRLRLVVQPDGRRVAFVDYGPRKGRPLVVLHALASGRTLPPRLAGRLQAAGFRPIIPQRPGFGLTDPQIDDYLSTAADDVVAVLEAVRAETADVFARDIGVAALMALAQRHPDRLGRVLLLNPEGVRGPTRRPYAITAVAALLQRHPEITATFFEVLRRQTRTDRLAAIIQASFRNGAPSDQLALRQPEVLTWMIRDMQAMAAVTARGPISERLVYANGWRPPGGVVGSSWTIVTSRELGLGQPGAWWTALGGAKLVEVSSGGLLLAVSHPDDLVGLLTSG